MAIQKNKIAGKEKTAWQLQAAAEARLVAGEAHMAMDTRAARARARKQDEEEWVAAAKAAAKAREEARIAEEARISATGKDEWYYISSGEQMGPVPLAELRRMAADASIEPPLNLVWAEGMEEWKPVYEVRMVCGGGDLPRTETPALLEEHASFPAEAEMAGVNAAAESEAEKKAELRAAAEAKAAEEARLAALAKAEAECEARAKAELEVKAAVEAKAAAIAKAKADEEARAKAEAEARLRAAEAKAAEEARAAALAKARAEEEARARAEIDALAAEEARVAALARERAEYETRAKAEQKARAAEQARIKAAVAAARAKARREVRRKEKHVLSSESAPAPVETELIAGTAEAALVVTEPTAVVVEATPDTSRTPSEAFAPAPAANSKKSRFSGKAVWHYTSEGERLGPVCFGELRAMAAASTLDPRLDMVWKPGMDAWTHAGRIDGLFERRIETTELQKSAPAKSTATRRIRPGATLADGASWPGARRRSLLFAAFVFPLLWHILLTNAKPVLIQKFGDMMVSWILPFAAFVPLLLLLHFGLKRLVNLGMSRWWYLALLAPLLNLWVFYRCLTCPPGYAHHKKMDGTGIALAILYWSAVFCLVLMLASFVGPAPGMLEARELHELVRNIIRHTNLPGSMTR